jgi:hypothetical protein
LGGGGELASLVGVQSGKVDGMNDDWREETQLRLAQSGIYQRLKDKCSDAGTGTHILALIDDATYYAYHRTKTVLRHMGEFTLHDGEHVFRILRLMERLLGAANIESLSIPESMLLILSAFFHDIGMAPCEDDVCACKKVWDKSPAFKKDTEQKEYMNFKGYCSAREEELLHIETLMQSGNNSLADTMKSYLICEYIRSTHSTRARQIVQQDWNGKIKYRDTDLTVEFADICFSHTEDTLGLLELDANCLCGPDTVACLPLVAVILRLADILDFDAKRTPAVLFSHLAVKHPVSIGDWNRHRAVEAWDINERHVCFQAKCTHPAIEESIHAFCDLIDAELRSCNSIISRINNGLRTHNREIELRLPLNVDRTKICTKKNISGEPQYLYWRTKFELSKSQVVDLLMGTKLYANPEVALRELLQNSIDACLLRQAMEHKWSNQYRPEITVRYCTEDGDDILEVADNGIGMDQDIIDKYYSKIGASFYKSADFAEIKQEFSVDFVPTSRFGIGILSCFMVADSLVVDTRRVYEPHRSSDPIRLIVEGQESIFWVKKGERAMPGTTSKLILRKNANPWEKMTDDQFAQSVENVVPNPPFSLIVKSKGREIVRDEDSFKTIRAEALGDSSWRENNNNIRRIPICLGDYAKGMVGSAIVGILQLHGKPVDKIVLDLKEVEIEGESYTLRKEVHIAKNEIDVSATSITIDEDGEISEDQSRRSLAKSASRVSLHGIAIPATLFPEFWQRQHNQVCISWPFPLLLVVDVCGNRDLRMSHP